MALAVIMSACVKPEEPKEVYFSILGDSYSAFRGSVQPETNDVYTHYDSIGVTTVEQMWWHRLATKEGWILERNNSFSGSLVCNYNEFHAGAYYAPHSFIRRMDDLGHPDVIFVFGATNDACDGTPLGDYVYAGWTEEQLCTFRPALAYLFDNLNTMYPMAHVYFLLDMDLGSGSLMPGVKEEYIESIHRISSHYNVDCIDLFSIYKEGWHPNDSGHRKIAEQVAAFLEMNPV